MGQENGGVGDHPGGLACPRDREAFLRQCVSSGGVARTLPTAPHAVPLRTREDALQIRSALRPGAAVVIIGAVWIGAEVATAAAAAGCRVTVAETGLRKTREAVRKALA